MPRPRRAIPASQEGMQFARLLGELMTGMSVQSLASRMNVDRNLIYMWLRGDRLPGMDTDYVDKLAVNLLISPAQLEELRQALRMSHDNGSSRKNVPRAGMDAAGELIATAWAPRSSTRTKTRALKNLQVPDESKKGIIGGSRNVILAAIDMVAHAPHLSRNAPGTIFVTYQGSKSAFESNPTLLDAWNAAVSSALKKGYSVRALWRLDKNAARSIHLAQDTLALLGKGDYQPMHIPGGGVIDPAHDLLIVSGYQALTMYATTQPAQVDAAIRVVDTDKLDMLSGYASQCAAISESVMTFYLPKDDDESHRAGVAADIEAGRRILLKNGLSTVTRPLRWFEDPEILRSKTRKTGDKFASWVERELRRIPAFWSAARTGSFRDMCPQRAIVRLVRDSEYYRWDGITKRIDAGMAREHVENVIKLLETCDGYQLALLNEEEENRLDPKFCMVHGDTSVILEYEQPTGGEDTPVKMQITDTRIVSAFWGYLETQWDAVALRNKADCIAWLRSELGNVV